MANAIYENIIGLVGEDADIVAVGIGTIGPLDIRRGVVVNTPNLPLRTFPLKQPLEEKLGVPVYVINDAEAAAWGEKIFGAGKDLENLVYLTISTGIGAGVIVDGRLILGKDGNAHEVGHMVIDATDGLPCKCGGRGHWEAYASGSNIPRYAAWLARRKSPTQFGDSKAYLLALQGKLDAPTLYKLAREHDRFAEYMVHKLNKIHAAGIANIANAYDPEIITIGGSVFLYNIDLMLNEIVELARENMIVKPPEIKPTPLGFDAGLYGAVAIALKPPEALAKIQQTTIRRDEATN